MTIRWFVTARLLVWGGAGTSVVVLPALVHAHSGSAAVTALLGAVGVVPYLLLGLPAGAMADRHGRRALMVGGCFAGALALASVPLALLAGVLTTGHAFLAALVVGLALVLVDAAAFASIPALVGRDKIAEVNGLLTALGTVVGLVAPGIGGLLLTRLSPASVLWVEVVCLAAAGGVSLRLRAVDAGHDPASRPVDSLVRSIGQGLGYVAGHRLIGPLTFLGIGVSLATGAVIGLQVPHAVENFGLQPGSGLLGLVFVASAFGSALAGWTAPRVRRRWSAGRVATVGYPLGFVTLCGVAYAPSWPALLAALSAWSWCSVTVVINGIITRQVLAPDALQGRVHATARMIAWGGQPLGALLAAGLVGALGVRTTLVVAGTGLVIAAVAALVIGLPNRSAGGDLVQEAAV